MSITTYVFVEKWQALLMSTHNICFCGEIGKIFTGYPPLSRPMITLKRKKKNYPRTITKYSSIASPLCYSYRVLTRILKAGV